MAELTPKQHRAISALLTAPTLKAAAEQAGCGERSIRVWLEDAAFVAAYRAARREAVGQAVAQLQRLSGAAARTLGDIMESGAHASVRLAAARTILEMAIRAVELEDLAARIAALEERYEKH